MSINIIIGNVNSYATTCRLLARLKQQIMCI